MDLSTFFYLHGDAVGVALLLIGAAVILFIAQDRAHQRQQDEQRATAAKLRAKERAELHDRYGRIIKVLAQRRPTFAEEATQAIGLTKASPLADAYVFGQTVADVPSPYAPAFYDGRGVTR